MKEAEKIIKQVAEDHGISLKQMLGRSRTKTVVEARHTAMRIVRAQCGLSLSEMGKLFDRDPSTVLVALRQ